MRSSSALASNHLLTHIARTYGTPCWIYDANIILQKIEQLRSFDIIRFAQKACSNTHILRLMREQGVAVDAVSLGELERALVAGYIPIRLQDTHPASAPTSSRASYILNLNPIGQADPVVHALKGDSYGADNQQGSIVFTADLLDRPTLQRIIELNIPVNAGSLDMLSQLGEVRPGHAIWLRINPGFGYGHSKKTNTGGEDSKHGIWHERLHHALRLIKKYRLRLVGLHMHIGSGVNYRHLQQVCDAMVKQIKSNDIDVTAISAGGGLSVPYQPGDEQIDTLQYFHLWDQARKEIEQYLGHAVQLEIEPGRFLVAESGLLLSEVRAVKEVGRRHFVLVDAGFNDLIRPAMYGSYHEITLIRNGDMVTGPLRPTVVAGPLCESGDVFTQGEHSEIIPRDLPKAAVGDLCVFHNTGAYGASMSSNYNSRPLIAEIWVKHGQIQVIRRRQTITELIMLEQV